MRAYTVAKGGRFRHQNENKDTQFMAEGSDTSYWTLVTIIGPLLLLAVMIYAFTRNKKSKIDPEVTEQGTRDVYAAEQREHEADGKSGL